MKIHQNVKILPLKNEIVEPNSFLYMVFSGESRQKNNGGVSTGERVRERCEECVCVYA